VPVAYVEAFRNYLIWQMCELKPEIVSMAKDKERQYEAKISDLEFGTNNNN
jgi:hypothetical protein